MATVRPKLQIDVSNKIKTRAKAVAYDKDMSLNEFVLVALTKMGDEKLTKLVKEYLESKE